MQDDIILYAEKPRLHQVTNRADKLGKIAGYKINIKNSIISIQEKNEFTEKENVRAVPPGSSSLLMYLVKQQEDHPSACMIPGGSSWSWPQPSPALVIAAIIKSEPVNRRPLFGSLLSVTLPFE